MRGAHKTAMRLAPALIFAGLTSLTLASAALAAEPPTAEAGRKVALRACAGCHEVEGYGASPREDAPNFRKLYQRVDEARLSDMFQDGMMVGHSKMPVAYMSADEVAALSAYLETLRPKYGPGAKKSR